MSVPVPYHQLTGRWRGQYRLWLDPQSEEQRSDTDALVSLKARDKFLCVEYTWMSEGKPQEGLMLVGVQDAEGTIAATWVDAWHNGDNLMACTGRTEPDGSLTFMGHYKAPTGPDWGWKTTISPPSGHTFRVVMYNVTPEGQEMKAVEMMYEKTSQ